MPGALPAFLSSLLLRIKPADLGAVAAALHVAPAAVVILAGIEKEPFTVLGRAGADEGQLVGDKQIGGGAGDLPEKNIEVIEVVEAPLENTIAWDQAQMCRGDASVCIECGESGGRYGAMIDDGPEDVVDGLA